MSRVNEVGREKRHVLVTWMVLLGATLGSYWIAEGNRAAGGSTAAWVVGIALAKAHLVVGVFMEMIRAPRVWGIAMSLFLCIQAAVLVLLFG